MAATDATNVGRAFATAVDLVGYNGKEERREGPAPDGATGAPNRFTPIGPVDRRQAGA